MSKIKKKDVFDIELDEEEQEISDAIDKAVEQGTLKSVKHLKKEMADARKAAANYLRDATPVNLLISSNDLTQLKQEAAYKGLPYQILIASILHEYAAGHFQPI